MKRHRCAPGNYPGTSVVPGTHGTQKTNFSQGNDTELATNFAASTTSTYSNSCVSQGHEPPTSATLSIGLTTQPHWPLGGGRCSRRRKRRRTRGPRQSWGRGVAFVLLGFGGERGTAFASAEGEASSRRGWRLFWCLCRSGGRGGMMGQHSHCCQWGGRTQQLT
jgi:hypothetical protein